jgi:L-arabinokinase
VGIDSGIRHAVSGSSYADVRSAAFMGLRIIERELGLRLGGYLCRLGPAEFEQRCAPVLPEGMRGGEFLERYGSTGDTATRVEPDRVYRVRNCARHPVHENFRVRSFGKLLLQSIDNESLTLLGELMYQSHGSYSAVGLGHARTDEIVEMARATGPGSGVFGAKVTGGGSGGTVCLGCHGDEGLATARRICEDYRRRHGEEVTFFAA